MEESQTQNAQIESLRTALRTDASDPIATARLLEALLARFQSALADWPEGLRVDGARADLLQVQRLLGEVKEARGLDMDQLHADFLQAVETKARIMVGQLKSDEGRCFF